MGFFNKKGGAADVIRCDEPSYLIWKWHPSGVQEGSNKRENSIRLGSVLRVKDGEVAVFVYKQKDGTMQDYIEGPFDQTISTKNLPLLSSIIGLAYEGDTPFQAEIYFINLARIVQFKFGVPFFDVYDPRFLDFGVPVAVRGTVSFNITDYKEFIKLHRLMTFDLADFQNQVRDTVTRYVKSTVANAPSTHGIPVIQIESKTAQINDLIENDLKARLKKDFGVNVSGIDIGAIEIDKTSDGYAKLMAITQQITTATLKAKTDADILNYAETLRIQREEGQYAQHMGTQTANLAAFQTEKYAEVGIAGATALGQMGANGAGDVNLSGGGAGFNPAAMMAAIAVGGAVGQNVAGVMNGAMSGGSIAPATPPPPIPTVMFFVAIGGAANGPFNLSQLTNMVTVGTLAPDTLVWKDGLPSWVAANTVPELSSLFVTPPPTP